VEREKACMGRPGMERWKKMGRAQEEQYTFLFIQKYSNEFDLIQPKDRFPLLENFQIKSGFEAFELRNNFPYRNFLKFKAEFELKFREPLGVKFS
jgi:hypothetical protein